MRDYTLCCQRDGEPGRRVLVADAEGWLLDRVLAVSSLAVSAAYNGTTEEAIRERVKIELIIRSLANV